MEYESDFEQMVLQPTLELKVLLSHMNRNEIADGGYLMQQIGMPKMYDFLHLLPMDVFGSSQLVNKPELKLILTAQLAQYKHVTKEPLYYYSYKRGFNYAPLTNGQLFYLLTRFDK